jgi:arsenate reductase
MNLFLQYPKCGTCRKAAQWLKEHNVEVTSRDITLERPTEAELTEWIGRSGRPAAKFFNTSGLLYKERNLKEVIKSASEQELIVLLASDGKLVKRPVLVTDSVVLVGFNEAEWDARLISNL